MGRQRDAAFAGLIAIPALLLAGLSLKSANAAFATLGADATFDSVSAGHDPAAKDLLAAAASYREAAQSFEAARYNTAAASALLAAARGGAKVPDRPVELLVRAALQTSPASPFNWSRLAWLRFRSGDRMNAAKAWQMSVMTGRYKPLIMQSRLELGFLLLATQDRTFENAVRDQILVAARSDAYGLARLANRVGAEAIVRAALSDEAEVRTKYEAANKQAVSDSIAAAKTKKS